MQREGGCRLLVSEKEGERMRRETRGRKTVWGGPREQASVQEAAGLARKLSDRRKKAPKVVSWDQGREATWGRERRVRQGRNLELKELLLVEVPSQPCKVSRLPLTRGLL